MSCRREGGGLGEEGLLVGGSCAKAEVGAVAWGVVNCELVEGM